MKTRLEPGVEEGVKASVGVGDVGVSAAAAEATTGPVTPPAVPALWSADVGFASFRYFLGFLSGGADGGRI